MVQWLRLCTSSAGDAGSNPGRGTKIPHAVWHSQKKKKTLVISKIKKPRKKKRLIIFLNCIHFQSGIYIGCSPMRFYIPLVGNVS